MSNPYQSPRTPSQAVQSEDPQGNSAASAADRAYRRAALPWGLFMVTGGIVCCIVAFCLPAYQIFMPPFETEITKRAVFFMFAGFVLITGIGFIRRRPWALYAFVAYVLLGTALHVLVGLTDSNSRPYLASPLFNLPIGYVVYRLTRPAFQERQLSD